MIFSIAQEIAKWIAEHDGKLPASIRVPEAVIDACVEECKNLSMARDVEYARKYTQKDGMKILGIPVLVDPTLTIGKIDP